MSPRQRVAGQTNPGAPMGDLAGRFVAVTRPIHQSRRLSDLVTTAGGKAILFPTMEIVGIDDADQVQALIDRLHEFDIAIFVSPNAVNQAIRLIRARRELPSGLMLATIGAGGVRELERHGASGIIAPRRFDSEALLEMPQLKDVAGKHIVIFRGVGGRELLSETLRQRGALVEHAICYRRQRPNINTDHLKKARLQGNLDAIIATSSEGVRNLVLMAGDNHAWLCHIPLFVPHPRIEATALELGFEHVVLTGQGDEAIVRDMACWFATTC